MREIKFRAKSLITGEWVYGGYYDLDDCRKGKTRHIIVHKNNGPGKQTIHEPIDIKTLGQYTGFKDVNGKKIYEGNTVKAWYEENDGLGYREYNDVGKVVWGNGCWIIKMTSRDFAMASCDYDTELDVEVIGDIHEDKNLLEVEQ